MSTTAKRNGKTITLGSGDLLIKEYTGTFPEYSTFTESDILGYIKGGAKVSYKGEFYEVTDDSGKISKMLITSEEVVLSSGILTWNGDTLKKLSRTARVTNSGSTRTVKIGGASKDDGKSYALCFRHKDPIDGDCYLMIRGVNQAGFEIAFAKDAETVINAEFKAMPMDDEGTLITFVEVTGTASTGG